MMGFDAEPVPIQGMQRVFFLSVYNTRAPKSFTMHPSGACTVRSGLTHHSAGTVSLATEITAFRVVLVDVTWWNP